MTVAHNPCVLLIESDENLANQLAFDLKEAGYDPIVAHWIGFTTQGALFCVSNDWECVVYSFVLLQKHIDDRAFPNPASSKNDEVFRSKTLGAIQF